MRISQQTMCSACAALVALLLLLLSVATPAAGAPTLLRRLRRAAIDNREDNRDAAAAAASDDNENYEGDEDYAPGQQQQQQQRHEKQLPFFGYYPQLPPGAFVAPAPQYYDYGEYQDGDENEVLSRAEPTNSRKPVGYGDSPVYYIRMPPTPYVFVPGIGYVSQPAAPPPAFSPFINVPVDFVANGKPTSVYWRPSAAARPPPPPPPPPQRPQRPQADSPVTQLDQGPYVFNGRPTDLFLLRNTYNSLYNDALQNIYP